jgi:hypothetical protein
LHFSSDRSIIQRIEQVKGQLGTDPVRRYGGAIRPETCINNFGISTKSRAAKLFSAH